MRSESEKVQLRALQVSNNLTEKKIRVTAGTLAAGVLVCCVTYGCNNKPYPDPEEQARIAAENQTRLQCIQRGANWVPIIVDTYDNNEVAMACLTDASMGQVKQLQQPALSERR